MNLLLIHSVLAFVLTLSAFAPAASAQQRQAPDRETARHAQPPLRALLDPETGRELSAEDRARLDAFLANRPRTVVAPRPAGMQPRTPEPPVYRDGAIVFTVNSAYDDDPDANGDGTCAGPTYGECQLRSAIEEANAQPDTQPVRIEFDIVTGPPGSEIEPGVWRITLTYDGLDAGTDVDRLPSVQQPGLTIDALTQPGASCGDLVGGMKHDLRVILDGSTTGSYLVDGLNGHETGFTVRGLVVQNFSYAGIFNNSNFDALVECSYVGTDHTGEVSAGNLFGIDVDGSVRNNLISGNARDGVEVDEFMTGAPAPIIENNLIGTDADGTQPLSNGESGLTMLDLEEVDAIVRGNVISANGEHGVVLSAFGFPATDVSLYGNIIGLSRTGQSVGLGNSAQGINTLNWSTNNDIGVPSEVPNWIADNGIHGILIDGNGSGNRIRNNHIGFDLAGATAPNGFHGIASIRDNFGDPVNNVIGGPTAAEANYIAGNAQHGIYLQEDTSTRVEGNFIGLNHLGATLPNGFDGIALLGAANTTIRGNTIVANGGSGISFRDDGPTPATNTVIEGNDIGTNADGDSGLGNESNGVFCRNASSVRIGGPDPGQGNKIAYNGGTNPLFDGVAFTDTCTEIVLLQNGIFENSGLGIDFCPSFPSGCDAVTPNDFPDADGLTNFPIITSATDDGTETKIGFRLEALPNRPYRVELFRIGRADPSGHGEGKSFSGAQSVTTDGAGVATGSFMIPAVDFPAGQWASTTATLYNQDNPPEPLRTSEFSEAVQVEAISTGPDYDLVASNTSPLSVAPGGSVGFDYTITNTTAAAVSGQFWYTARTAGGATVAQAVIVSGSLPGGASTSGTYTQAVPSNAPAGTYTYCLRIGSFPGSVFDEECFALTVTNAPRQPGGATTWAVRDVTPWAPTTRSTAAPQASSQAGVPERFALHAAYPNPFNPSATLRFEVPEAAHVRLTVHDALGREVAVLVNGPVEAGSHTARFEAGALPSGVYLARLTSESGFAQTQRLTLLR